MSKIVRSSINLNDKCAEIQTNIDQMFVDFQQMKQHSNIQKQRVIRNILLVGPSKGGKTTLKHILIDPRYISEKNWRCVHYQIQFQHMQ